MTDVFIVGTGIHPFGRTDYRTGLQQGAYAVRAALADAGIEWPDVQFAYGGSDAAGNADTMVSDLGPTGLQFINVSNGCATGGSALFGAYSAIKSGQFDLGIAVGFDKHPRGSFSPKPADWSLPDWYGDVGLMLTTQFFAMKIRRYMHRFGITERSLVRVAEKAFRNGALADHAWRRAPVDADTIANSQMVSDPLTKYMFCSPAEGGVALVLASEARARQMDGIKVRLKAAAVRTRPAGSFEVFAPMIDIENGGTATRIASRAAFEMAGVGPGDIDVAQLQGHRVGRGDHAHGRERLLCGWRAGAMVGRRADRDWRRDAGQHRWRLPGMRRADWRLWAPAGL